jgi:hypothetical protein
MASLKLGEQQRLSTIQALKSMLQIYKLSPDTARLHNFTPQDAAHIEKVLEKNPINTSQEIFAQ